MFLEIETRWRKIKESSRFFKVKLKSAILASEWPRRPNMSSDLKFLTQITYDYMLNLTFWAFRNSFLNFGRRRRRRRWNGQLLDLRCTKVPQVKTVNVRIDIGKSVWCLMLHECVVQSFIQSPFSDLISCLLLEGGWRIGPPPGASRTDSLPMSEIAG